MNVQISQGKLHEMAADTLVVGLYEGEQALSGAVQALDQALGGALSDLLAEGDFK
ncbi:MAG: M17 family peptidase N-terminal domain-containing protein, partial [Chloroflexota bacterium]